MARRSTQDTEEPLIIDRAAAAEIPSPEAVREWGHGKRAFISSVMAELANERQAAATAVRTVNVRPIMFEQFSERVTMKAHAPDDLYQLHDEKIIARLYSYLTDGKPGKALAWRVPPPANRPHRAFGQWLALHPALGNAILSVKAMALAKSLGLDIVTDATHVHEVVAGQTEEDVLAALLGEHLSTKKAPATDDTVDDLAEIVMRTAFDVRGLTAKQIGQLLAERQRSAALQERARTHRGGSASHHRSGGAPQTTGSGSWRRARGMEEI